METKLMSNCETAYTYDGKFECKSMSMCIRKFKYVEIYRRDAPCKWNASVKPWVSNIANGSLLLTPRRYHRQNSFRSLKTHCNRKKGRLHEITANQNNAEERLYHPRFDQVLDPEYWQPTRPEAVFHFYANICTQ